MQSTGYAPNDSAGQRRRIRSTLLTSPRSQADFLVRLAFFAIAPLVIVRIAAVFPVIGALLSVGVATVVFLAGEAFRKWAASSRLVGWLLDRELSVADYYRGRPPRPFAYYVFYPLLFPYWLINRDARREFWLFKGYTIASLVFLIGSVIYQYFAYWKPDLGLHAYARVVVMTLVVAALLVLWLVMPIATTVIGFHGTMRRGRLLVLLLVALGSTSFAVTRLVLRRDPIVSYSTRERVRLRTDKDPRRARDVQVAALRDAWHAIVRRPNALEDDGKVEGLPLERAHETLRRFYKRDEAFAFDLWASPRNDPRILVLYFEARYRQPPIWAAVKLGGEEVRDPKQLPRGAFIAMKRAAEE